MKNHKMCKATTTQPRVDGALNGRLVLKITHTQENAASRTQNLRTLLFTGSGLVINISNGERAITSIQTTKKAVSQVNQLRKVKDSLVILQVKSLFF